jgi:hypothetical protein
MPKENTAPFFRAWDFWFRICPFPLSLQPSPAL